MPDIPAPFLATTALEEFWDPSKPIVFLAESCRLFNREAAWNKPGHSVLPSPWMDAETVREGFRIVEETCEWLLPLLAKRLNAVHGTGFGDRYWKIVAGPWLIYFAHVAYDHHLRITSALKAYPSASTIGLDEKSFTTPSDIVDFIRLAKGDLYNLQIFTRILKHLGHRMPRKPFAPASAPGPAQSVKKHFSPKSIGILVLRKANEALAPILVRTSYFPSKWAELGLVARTRGRVAFSRAPLADVAGVHPDPSMRSGLANLTDSSERDDFRLLLTGLLPKEIPVSLMEGFRKIRSQGEKEYPKRPKIIFSTPSYLYDETFKQWAADRAERGTLLAGIQHGGNYGCFLNMPYHEFEFAIADRYYSWGWTVKELGPKIKPFPATKLCRRSPMHADNSLQGILYVTTDTPRYTLSFQYSEYHHLSYIDWQLRFLAIASPRFGKALRIRPHIEDSGWGYVSRWKEVAPDLAVETWSVPFLESLKNCRLYVSDHIETTFVEALAADKPSIVFYNPDHRVLREEARPYYEALRNADILHHSPESAAAAIEKAHPDIESWWNDPGRQAARASFCGYFALSGPDALGKWAAEFRSLAKSPHFG